MLPERLPPDTPGEWINRAHSDLVIARIRLEGVYLEDLCYHAQQAAEKALKALLLHRVGRFPFVHDLAQLVTQLEQAGMAVPETVREATALTHFAVKGRYPGFDEPVTEPEWKRVVASAENVLLWAETIIQARPA
jgi:HEPN domain-containing protein